MVNDPYPAGTCRAVAEGTVGTGHHERCLNQGGVGYASVEVAVSVTVAIPKGSAPGQEEAVVGLLLVLDLAGLGHFQGGGDSSHEY